MKSTAVSGVKEYLQSCVYNVSKSRKGRWPAFCIMSLRVSVSGMPKGLWSGGEAKASPKRATKLLALDPKRR